MQPSLRWLLLVLLALSAVVAAFWLLGPSRPSGAEAPQIADSGDVVANNDPVTPVEEARASSEGNEPRSLAAGLVGDAEVPTADAGAQTIEPLSVERHIHGTVVDPFGLAATSLVEARDSSGRTCAYELTDEQGRFKLEPSGASPWIVTAKALHGRFARSRPVTFEAGAHDVTLHLLRASKLFGVVVDSETGAPRKATVQFATRNGGRSSGSASAPNGDWEFGIVEPGKYHVSARSRDGAWAVESDIDVPEDADVGPIRLALQPCANLTLRYRGSAVFLECTVTAGDLEIAQMGFSPQRGFSCDVPAREIRVELRDARMTWTQERTLQPKPGERLEVVFD